MANEGKEAKKLPLRQLLVKQKPCAIMLLLKDSQQVWYPSKLARASGSSYIHAINFLEELKGYGVVVSEKKGKQNTYRLTEKGATLAVALDDLVKKCDSAEAEMKAEKQPAPQAEQAASANAKK